MMPDEISVRQWQELYRAGAFEGKELDIACKAGWRDWHCRFDALAGRLKLIAPVVTGIQESVILDHYFLWFANVRCSGRKAVYDRVWFEALDSVRKGRAFYLEHNNPNEPEKWTLYTERFGFQSPEFGCTRTRDMIKYISRMAPELEQGIRPSFLDEQAAAARYALRRSPLYPSGAVCRTGSHSYSFLDWSGRKKTIHVARSRKDIPPEYQTPGIMRVNRLYVYCPEDAGEDLSAPQRIKKKSSKRREPER